MMNHFDVFFFRLLLDPSLIFHPPTLGLRDFSVSVPIFFFLMLKCCERKPHFPAGFRFNWKLINHPRHLRNSTAAQQTTGNFFKKLLVEAPATYWRCLRQTHFNPLQLWLYIIWKEKKNRVMPCKFTPKCKYHIFYFIWIKVNFLFFFPAKIQ